MATRMMIRTLYLFCDTSLDRSAAKAAASTLASEASFADLRLLLDSGWLTGPDPTTIPDYTDEQLAALGPQLRAEAEHVLHQAVDRLAGSLDRTDVHHFRFDCGDDGIDAYSTGGLSSGEAPTDAFDAWDVVFDDANLPATWPRRIGAAAGLLQPWGTGPAICTVTFHAWG